MYFLIDFENVRNAGMQGSEYLQPADHVIVFYSAAASGMEQRHLDNIQASGCGFETYKLRRQGKNGLDFYIATKVGELFGANRCQSAVLVSNDAGFKAIREFWQECSGTKNRVAISSSIENGIISVNEVSERATRIRAHRKTMDIGHFYAAYREREELLALLRKAFSGTAYTSRLREIEEILKPGATRKVLYLDSLRRFGRQGGQEVYRILKTCATG